MVHIVWIIGLLTALWGIAAIFKPAWMKTFINAASKSKNVYLVIATKVVIGILFLIFARECRWPMAVIVIGVLTALGAGIFGMLPFRVLASYMNWWQKQPLWVYRVWGILAALFGFFIMYAGVPQGS